jgi:hypothetical protein
VTSQLISSENDNVFVSAVLRRAQRFFGLVPAVASSRLATMTTAGAVRQRPGIRRHRPASRTALREAAIAAAPAAPWQHVRGGGAGSTGGVGRMA